MRVKTLMGLLLTGLLLLVTVHPHAQTTAGARKLDLSFDHQGHVTLVAQNVTVREILAEWARLGGTTMVNADKLTGGPISVQFEAQPEAAVLESLLRSSAGYILYPRLQGTQGASSWQSVSILATSHPTTLYTPAAQSAPQIAPVVQSMPDDEIPPVTVTPNPAQTQPASQPNRPAPGPGVYVPVQGVQPGAGSSTTMPATGRGRGGL